MSNHWVDKAADECDQIVDDVRGKAYRQAAIVIDRLMSDLSTQAEGEIWDVLDQYADGISQEKMNLMANEFVKAADARIVEQIERYIKGH